MPPHLLWIAPFVLLLLAIALAPLFAPHAWERNRHKALLCLLLGLPVVVETATRDASLLAHTAHEYVSFILLLGALFTISGGIQLSGDLRATPFVNTTFLAIGAVLANAIGTTGASMLLIRPVLRTNMERHHTRHIPVFFIFIVSNCGGLLTPLGDPPLFLGFLRGVPFTWTLQLWPIWLFVVGVLLVLFFLWDRAAYRRESISDLRKDETSIEPLRLRGTINIAWLALVVAGSALPTPWREAVLLGGTLASLWTTPAGIRRENQFTAGPIVEVAILFAGIFATMIPALEILRAEGPSLGVREPWEFFWLSGTLSSFLDNAPTYLTFLSLAQGLGLPAEVAGAPEALLTAISAGSVLMGATTYIGNGPNFMVKAIAESQGVPMPGFFGYMGYSATILLPIFAAVTLLFFR
jgi:Na+/H+ antiporter NhaD/arsenite permease-like protein